MATAGAEAGRKARIALLAGFLLATLVLPFLAWGDALERAFAGERAIAWLESYGNVAWAAAILLLSTDILLPIPSSVVIGALGAIYGPVTGGLIAWVGLVCSGLAGYALARTLGRPAARLLVGERQLDAGERRFDRAGGWLVSLSRWVPVLAELVAFLAGLGRMRVAVFLAAVVAGTAPIAFVYAAIGHGIADRPLLALAICAVLPALIWLVAEVALRRHIKGGSK